MHNIAKGRELYGVSFNEPWENIFSYTLALRAKQSFDVKAGTDRGVGIPSPLERPYEMLDLQERQINWDVVEIFRYIKPG